MCKIKNSGISVILFPNVYVISIYFSLRPEYLNHFLKAYDLAYVISRVEYDFPPSIENDSPIFFHRGISNHLCIFLWLFQYLTQKQDIVIFGEDYTFMKYLPRQHCHLFVEGIAFNHCEEDDECIDEIEPICRDIYKCHITERYHTQSNLSDHSNLSFIVIVMRFNNL